MVWQAPSLEPVCPAGSNLTVCSGFGYTYLFLLAQLYSGSLDERIQKSIGYKDEPVDAEEYDFIVVGAGAAGCLVTNRLSENFTVLLLEAGPEEPDITEVPGLSTVLVGSNIDWGYSSVPDGKYCLASDGICSWPRGKVMGGTTAINTLVYVRGHPQDFDSWEALGNEGWGYDDVLPYFKKTEKNYDFQFVDVEYHGFHGDLPIVLPSYVDEPTVLMLTAYNQTGLPVGDFNGKSEFRVGQAQIHAQKGLRASANYVFIRPIRYVRDNLVVRPNAEVTKLIIDDNNKVNGVKYIKEGKEYTAYSKKEVIVSGGTINSPKLLLQSGIGPKEQLESLNIPVIADLPVGENLQDHVTINAFPIAIPRERDMMRSKGEILKEIYEFKEATFKKGPLTGCGPESVIAFIKVNESWTAPDIEFETNRAYWEEFLEDPVNALSLMPASFYDGVIPRPNILVPYSTGRVTLNPEDPNGDPLIYPGYFTDERDFETIVKGVKFALKLDETEAFKSSGAHYIKKSLPACSQYEWGTDEYISCTIHQYTTSAYHPAGTCKMGPASDPTAVVDPKLRVHGVEGLRVIDASIMPNITRSNIVADVYLIAERGVAFVLEDYLETSSS